MGRAIQFNASTSSKAYASRRGKEQDKLIKMRSPAQPACPCRRSSSSPEAAAIKLACIGEYDRLGWHVESSGEGLSGK